MPITRAEVQRIALLARLRFTAEQEARLTVELTKILEYVAALQEVDTSAVEPMAHALDVVNAWREDVVTNGSDTESLLANAPATDGNFFQVPKIIE
jgi:aspartyl-tRNA(Asn)/glutamyl-tRNA(Gln) amidotransferase subunit C